MVSERSDHPVREAARKRFEISRAKWPHIVVDFEAFEAYFARHASESLPDESYAADQYLACAAALEADGALVAVDAILSREVSRALGSIDPSRAFVEEGLQATRERLLVRRGDAPGRIIEYGGRAPLQSWLCAVAIRLAISRRRRKSEQRHEPFAEKDDARLASGGPEFEYLRRRYRGAFEEAVRKGIEKLPAKSRMLLRLNLVDGMSIDHLATAYRVGRSTVARWLVSARDALFEEARRELRTELGLTSSELDSLATDIRSQLDVSILRLLRREGSNAETK
jgi:RNA polymerase sigma-70 factor (ECF subfamily)